MVTILGTKIISLFKCLLIIKNNFGKKKLLNSKNSLIEENIK